MDRLIKLSAIRRAIGNFVHILTKRNDIKVRFSSGEQSFTNGDEVTISATDDPKKFDHMVGLALHEGAHCLLSDFPFLNAVSNEYTFYGAVHPFLRDFMEPSIIAGKKSIVKELQESIHDLMNIIEDRRIDTYIYERAPGYRGYYDAMYREMFYNPKIEEQFRTNPLLRVPTIPNYLDWLLMSFSDVFDPNALPGLDKMAELIDYTYIRSFDEPRMPDTTIWRHENDQLPDPFIGGYIKPFEFSQFPKLWKIANELMVMIIQQVQMHNPDEQDQMSFSRKGTKYEVSLIPNSGEEGDPPELPNYDPTGMSNEELSDLIEKVKKAVRGQLEKKTLDKAKERQLRALEESGTEQVTIEDEHFGHIPCIVVKKLTSDVLDSSWFPFKSHLGSDEYAVKAVEQGTRMGAILTHKLVVRNETNVTEYTRKSRGHIDRRLLAQLGTDNTSVFKRRVVDKFNPALLYFTLDASDSMGGMKWQNTLSVAIAAAYASKKLSGLETVITLRGLTHDSKPLVVVAFDSRTDSFSKIQSLFPRLQPSGSTPEGLCFSATHTLIEECTKKFITYMVNVSDGEPGAAVVDNYGNSVPYFGMSAVKQTKHQVDRIRMSGVEILSYFVTHHTSLDLDTNKSVERFKKMYGPTASFVEPTKVTEIAKTLNKLLLQKEVQ